VNVLHVLVPGLGVVLQRTALGLSTKISSYLMLVKRPFQRLPQRRGSEARNVSDVRSGTSDGYGRRELEGRDVGDEANIREQFTSVVQVSVGGRGGEWWVWTGTWLLLQVRLCSGDASRRVAASSVNQPSPDGSAKRIANSGRSLCERRLQRPFRQLLSRFQVQYAVFYLHACAQAVFQREKPLRCASQAVLHV
jgi:hypothetical protein